MDAEASARVIVDGVTEYSDNCCWLDTEDTQSVQIDGYVNFESVAEYVISKIQGDTT